MKFRVLHRRRHPVSGNLRSPFVVQPGVKMVRLYRRSGTLVLFTRQERLVAADYALKVEKRLSILQCTVLAALDEWTSMSEITARLGFLNPGSIRTALGRLHRWRLVEASTEPEHPRRVAVSSWGSWLPEAGFFHFSTRDLPRVALPQATENLGTRVALVGAPAPLKPAVGKTLALDPYPTRGGLPGILRERRSWRRFGPGAITRQDLSTLLGLTWGVQRWMHVIYGIRSALKTSPSSGATHSLEVYVIAQKIRGLTRGIYRYLADDHELELVRSRIAHNAVRRYLDQSWFEGCAAAFCMTAVWERVQFKYNCPRTYASVHIEAGHFAQTFSLLATSLGLAPFCTGAFTDATMHQALKIDGVRESALFVTGVGRRPKGVAWAPWPDPKDVPRTSLPAVRLAAARRGR